MLGCLPPDGVVHASCGKAAAERCQIDLLACRRHVLNASHERHAVQVQKDMPGEPLDKFCLVGLKSEKLFPEVRKRGVPLYDTIGDHP